MRPLTLVLLLAAVASAAWAVDGNAPPPGKRLGCTVSWIGNSFPGAKQWVQQDIQAVFVAPDGTLFTNIGWDEAGREVGVYRDGVVLGTAGHTHGWGYNGGQAIAANSKYVFIGQSVGNEGGGLKDADTWPAKGFGWNGVSRRLRADITQGAPFAGGKGGKGDTLKGCFLRINEAPERASAPVTGLWATEQRLYASNPASGRVQMYDAETMAPLKEWPVERPGPLAMDAAGRLWVLQSAEEGKPAAVLCFTGEGEALPQRIAFPDAARPTGLCVGGRDRLLVSDAGPDQQVRLYGDLGTRPRQVGTFGAKGGILSGVAGRFGDLRFNDPAAVGCDGQGNLYVASDGNSGGGGTVLECYTPAGRLKWRLFGLEFVDMADVDPGADTDVYTKEEHFRMDYSRPAGQEWRYRGSTVNRFKYPEDPRLHIWSAGAWVRRIQGRPFLFVTEMNGGYLQVYRFNERSDGETAIPSGLFAGRRIAAKGAWPPHQPEKGEWIWRDADGNGAFAEGEYASNGGADAPGSQGWWVDDNGNVWQATETQGIRKFALQGLDPKGNPRWSYPTMQTFSKPEELAVVKRLRYDPRTDTMYLGGCTPEHKNQHWKPMGPVICRYDHWSMPERKLRWKIVAPYEQGSQGHSSCEPMGFDLAGEYLFVPYTGASRAMGVSSGHIEVFRADAGRSVGSLEPSAEVGEIGLQDIRECLRAYRRPDGEYLVLLEEDWKSKVLLYRWRP